MAAQPVPWRMVLNSPPANADAPSMRRMSQGQGGLEGEDVAAVDAQGIALQSHQVDLGGEVGEEHVAPAPAAHQGHALAGDGLLEHAADAARALVLEVDLALVGDHRPLAGHHLAVQGDPEHARVLQGEGLPWGGRLEVPAEQLTAHRTQLPSPGGPGHSYPNLTAMSSTRAVAWLFPGF